MELIAIQIQAINISKNSKSDFSTAVTLGFVVPLEFIQWLSICTEQKGLRGTLACRGQDVYFWKGGVRYGVCPN